MSDWVWWIFGAGGVLAWTGALALRLRVKLPARPCHYCGYDLTGIDTDQVCPECGNPHTLRLERPYTGRLVEVALWIAIGSVVAGILILGLAALSFLFLIVLATTGACAPTLLLSSRTRDPCPTLFCVGAALASVASMAWFSHDAFALDSDWAFSSTRGFLLPPIGVAGAGYGVLVAAFVCGSFRFW